MAAQARALLHAAGFGAEISWLEGDPPQGEQTKTDATVARLVSHR